MLKEQVYWVDQWPVMDGYIPSRDLEGWRAKCSIRLRKCLERLSIKTLHEFASHREECFLIQKNFGETSFIELNRILQEFGYPKIQAGIACAQCNAVEETRRKRAYSWRSD